jgi:hypothetical protein
MRLHTEISLITLLGLVHVGIARLVGVLGRRRRVDELIPEEGAPPGFDIV